MGTGAPSPAPCTTSRKSPDGKQVVPVSGNEAKSFEDAEEAKSFASSQSAKFDRVVVMRKTDEGQKLVERYVDGTFERPEDIVRRQPRALVPVTRFSRASRVETKLKRARTPSWRPA